MSFTDKGFPPQPFPVCFSGITLESNLEDKRFYVYLHRRKDNGIVFYVGKGTGRRLTSKRSSKGWNSVFSDAGGFTYEIYQDGLTEEDALHTESYLIQNPKPEWCLVNQVVKFKTNVLTLSDIEGLVEYDETSPSCLRHKCWNNSRIKKTARYAGDVAGYLNERENSPPYYKIRLNGKQVSVHRAVWILHNGEIPDGMVINHINNNSLDNRIENLELVSQAVNSRRSVKSKDDGSGVYRTVLNGSECICYNISINGVRTGQAFSIKKYGESNAMFLATTKRRIKLFEFGQHGYVSHDSTDQIEQLKSEYNKIYSDYNKQQFLNLNIRLEKFGKYRRICCSWRFENKPHCKTISYRDGGVNEALSEIIQFAETKKLEYESIGLIIQIKNNVQQV